MAEKQRILIVDDDYNIAELISLYLTKECFETKIVGDGEEALRVFPEFQPNLILLDLMLPGIDGYQVCRELRSTSQVPIIMLSAKGEIFDKVLGLELGADDYMIKPFDSKELVARVKAVLRRYQLPAQHRLTARLGLSALHDRHPFRSPAAFRRVGYAAAISAFQAFNLFFIHHAITSPSARFPYCVS